MLISAPAAPTAEHLVDEALMRFPYDEWIPMPDAARHVRDQGLPRRFLTTVVRTGRRRGVLRTRKTPEVHFVMRIHDAPRRQPAPPL
ncbi:hypothetical protein [Streptomyces sp. NPDC000880]